MLTIDETPRDQRFLMVTHRLSRSAWDDECEAVRQWLANSPDTISATEADEMLMTIAKPLPSSCHPFVIIHCYADIPTRTHWNIAFDTSHVARHEATNATLQFGLFWRRVVQPTLEHGHHQIAVLEFSDGLPDLLTSLPMDPNNEVTGYVGLCTSDDFPSIRHQLAKMA